MLTTYSDDVDHPLSWAWDRIIPAMLTTPSAVDASVIPTMLTTCYFGSPIIPTILTARMPGKTIIMSKIKTGYQASGRWRGTTDNR
jgi:hypothetical protein